MPTPTTTKNSNLDIYPLVNTKSLLLINNQIPKLELAVSVSTDGLFSKTVVTNPTKNGDNDVASRVKL